MSKESSSRAVFRKSHQSASKNFLRLQSYSEKNEPNAGHFTSGLRYGSAHVATVTPSGELVHEAYYYEIGSASAMISYTVVRATQVHRIVTSDM